MREKKVTSIMLAIVTVILFYALLEVGSRFSYNEPPKNESAVLVNSAAVMPEAVVVNFSRVSTPLEALPQELAAERDGHLQQIYKSLNAAMSTTSG